MYQTLSKNTFCKYSTVMRLVRLPEQTVIISQYGIKWLRLITESKCLPRGTSWLLKNNSVNFHFEKGKYDKTNHKA